MKEAIQPDGVARPAAPYSPVVVSGDLVYTAGPGRIRRVRAAHGRRHHGPDHERCSRTSWRCLEAAGCGPADVIKVNAYLNDLGDFAGFNEVYKTIFQEPYPARTTVGVSLPGGILVEVEAIARKPG